MSMMLEMPYASGKSANANPVIDDYRSQVVQQYGGKWYHAAKQGRVFTGSGAAAGLVLPIFSNTAQLFGLWNPAGSGVNAVLCNVAMTYVDTTGAAGGYCFGINKNIGNALATGGISAFTDAAPDRAIGPATGGNKVRFTSSAATTIAPVLWRHLGWNQLVLTATDATTAAFDRYREFDGDWVVGPGCAIWLTGNIANLAKFVPSLTWCEEAA